MVLRAGRTYVRRERPGGIIIMALLMALGTALFVLFAKPAVNGVQTSEERRFVSDVTLPGENAYLVSLSQADSESDARVEAARYVPRGAAGYIIPLNGKYHVIGSGYASEDESVAVAAKLASDEGVAAVSLAFSQQQARLRINSTESQLEAFTGADEAVIRAARDLREYALRLDKSLGEPVEIRAKLQTGASALSAAYDRLNRAAGENPNGTVKRWLELLSLAQSRFDGIASGTYKTKLYMSSAVKHAFIDLSLGRVKALKDLA